VAIGSGTDAIEPALRALAIGPGDEVVTQANTCVPTVAGIAASGATPVICDVERAAGTMSPSALRQVLSSSTRAVAPVHLYGQCSDVHELLDVLDGREIALVEDCAHAHGDAGAGTWGVAGCFSFYLTKNLGALGDAGAVVTDRIDLVHRLCRMRTCGDEAALVAPFGASRMDEIQHAVLRAKLSGLREEALSRHVVSLPVYPGLSDEQVQYVIDAARGASTVAGRYG
jgi:dTDP-4-amino-4,6-dideoxygalactose transaminase